MSLHDSYALPWPVIGIQVSMLGVLEAFFVAAVPFYRARCRAHALVFVIGAGGQLLFHFWQFLLFFRPVSGTSGIALEEPSDWAIHQGISLVCWGLMAYGLVSLAYVDLRRRS